MASRIIQDMSRYQVVVDFPYLKSLGQNHVMLKAGSGNLTPDRKFEQHYGEATRAGMLVSPYFWVDPIYDPIKQAQFFLNLIQFKNIGFIVLDFEHWWGDWQKWAEMNQGLIPKSAVPVIPPDRMIAHFRTVYEYMRLRTSKKIVVYTAAWFLNSYCKAGYSFLKDKYTHWADYGLFNTTKVTTNWNYLESVVPAVGKRIPTLPYDYPLDKVLMWQYSGDKFAAYGVWGDEYKRGYSRLDLNVWVHPTITIDQFAGVSEPVPQPEPEPEPVPVPIPTEQMWIVTSTTGLKIRSLPSSTSPQIGLLQYNERFNTTSVVSGWGKLAGRDGYSAIYYAKQVFAPPPPPVENAITKWKVTATLGLNIRVAASSTSTILGSFPYGTIVEITSIANGWGKLYGRTGYIAMPYVVKVS